MVLSTVGILIIAFIISHAVTIAIFKVQGSLEFTDIESYRRLSWIVQIVVFASFFIFANIILSRHMTKRISKPLETLNEGVRQIHENNLSYRIEYHEDDEFRPVCETFNQMADRLEKSTTQRLKDEANRRELLAGISHDLRTPLTAISGYLDGIESGVASTPEMRNKYFSTIKKQTLGMKHIIEQLFLFSKLDMNEFPFTPSRFDIMSALSDIIEELTDEYSMRGIDISIIKSIENVFIYADVVHFRRVIINILENSAMYKEKETGRMEISAFVDNNFLLLKFTDDGPGVNPDVIPNLFNAFFRADPSRHTKGSGLGLAISAKIIERSGGSIYVENGDTNGLSIFIRLPLDIGSSING
jgi:signal transduction histidine kinase